MKHPYTALWKMYEYLVLLALLLVVQAVLLMPARVSASPGAPPSNWIHRLNTVGGIAPSGACTAGDRREVPYTADYYFYGGV